MSLGTPHLTGRSILARVSSIPRSFISYLSGLGLGRSLTTLDKIVHSIKDNQEKSVTCYIGGIRNNDSIPMVISDNLNKSQIQRIGPDGRNGVDGMNTLLKSLPPLDLPTISLTRPILTPIDAPLLIQYFNNLPPSFLDPKYQDMVLKVDLTFPHLRSFVPHPFLPAKSSSKDDIKNYLMQDIFEEKLQVGHKPAILVVDPEPYNLITGMIHSDPRLSERWKFLIPFIGLFHLRMHFCSGTLLDPSNYILLWRRILPLCQVSSFYLDWVRIKIEAFSRFSEDGLPSFKNRIKLIKHYLNSNITNQTPLPKGTDACQDLLNYHPEGDSATFEDKKMMATFHLMYLLANEGNGRNWTTTTRNHFSYWKDPKRNIRILRTTYQIWKEMEEEGLGGGPGMEAFRTIMDEIEILVLPFDDLFIHGEASTFFTYLPKIISKIAYDHHPTLLRGYLPFLHLLNHWKSTNPSIISFISHYIHHLNDSIIENFNSQVSHAYNKHGTLTFEGVASSVSMTAQKAGLRDQLSWTSRGESEGRSEYVQIYNDKVKARMKSEMKKIIDDCRRSEIYALEGICLMPKKYEMGRDKMINYLEKLKNPTSFRDVPLIDVKEELKVYRKETLIQTSGYLESMDNEVR